MKISIITVCYNSAKTIEKTIKSVLNNNYPDLEYIIIDGDSNDGTIDIIKKYSNEIAVFVSEPDNGLWDAMNKGISHCTGEIVGIINSDDYYYLDTLTRVQEIFYSNDVDYIMGPVQRGGKVRVANNPSKVKYSFSGIYSSHSVGFFCKKYVYDFIGFYNIKYHSSDYDFYLKMINKYKGIIIRNNNPFGFFETGGYSSKAPLFSKILEQAEIRRLNGFGIIHTLILMFIQLLKHIRKI